VGTKGEGAASPASLHRRFDAQRLPPKKAVRMGDKAKPLGAHTRAGGFAVFEAAFLCWPTHREISKRSEILMRLTLKAGEASSPIRPTGANFGPDISTEGSRGFFFT
jgi:hypothetical protein